MTKQTEAYIPLGWMRMVYEECNEPLGRCPGRGDLLSRCWCCAVVADSEDLGGENSRFQALTITAFFKLPNFLDADIALISIS